MQMTGTVLLILVSAILACIPTAAGAAEDSPDWAYPVNPPDFKPSPDDGSLRRVPDSTLSLTLSQVRDLFFAPDWHPEAHAQMPSVAPTPCDACAEWNMPQKPFRVYGNTYYVGTHEKAPY